MSQHKHIELIMSTTKVFLLHLSYVRFVLRPRRLFKMINVVLFENWNSTTLHGWHIKLIPAQRVLLFAKKDTTLFQWKASLVYCLLIYEERLCVFDLFTGGKWSQAKIWSCSFILRASLCARSNLIFNAIICLLWWSAVFYRFLFMCLVHSKKWWTLGI
jgi:hypothetical protein